MWSHQEKQNVARRAIFESITSSTVQLVPSRGVPRDQLTFGSGVCVEYSGRPFIVTARHVVDGLGRLGFSPREIAVGTRLPEPLDVNFTGEIPDYFWNARSNETRLQPFVSVTKSSDLDDLAILHMSGRPSDFAPLRFHIIPKDCLSPVPPAGVFVVGFAEETTMTRPEAQGSGDLRLYLSFCALEAILVERREGLRNFDADHHYLTDFKTGGDTEDYLRSPNGMSGGGVWSLPPEVAENQIWIGTGSLLVGIQSAWFEKAKLLKVIRIERVLELFKSVEL